MFSLGLFAACVIAGLAYAIFLRKDEEKRQELRRLSRAAWIKAK